MSFREARNFFLQGESYFRIEMPDYFRFKKVLLEVHKILNGQTLSGFQRHSPREEDNTNHKLLNNKDGKYAWRPIELMHPALYVSLVHNMTEQNHWILIRKKLKEFGALQHINCASLPVKSLTKQKDVAELINQWWVDVEQASLQMSLDYEFIIRTDLTDCYASIYTHSIAWALHTKAKAKKKQTDMGLVGNVIDKHIREMHNGQTNGIPQGSVLMDLVAELVLGYADAELEAKIASSGVTDYHILRYRDDYRIFVNNPKDGDLILRCLSEVMIELGLKLSPEKTDVSSEVVHSSIKEDKLQWLFGRQNDRDLQKHLLIIHNQSVRFPNAGSVSIALTDYSVRLQKVKWCPHPLSLISIVADIAYRNPNTYRISASIISQLLMFITSTPERQEIVGKIVRRFRQLPNTGHMEIWLQWLSLGFSSAVQFEEALCQFVLQRGGPFWNNQWISSRRLQSAIDSNHIVDWKILDKSGPVIPPDEGAVFVPDSGGY